MTDLRIFALPFVAVAIAAVALVAPGSDTGTRAPRSVTVTQFSYACPNAGAATVATGRVAAHDGARATALALPGEGSVDALTPVDSWNEAKVADKSLLVSTADAQGAGAVGFYGAVAPPGEGGGFGVGACPGVVQDSWYVGGGSGAKHFSIMTLTNVSDSPAVADVSLWGEKGIVDAVAADGIALDAFETRRINLDSLAAGEPELAVHVHSRRGALSVAMRDTSTAVFGGTEPLVATSAPARRLVIGGIAGGVSNRQLLAVNPGDTTARVTINALGKDGAFVPTGLADVQIPAGTVKAINIPTSAGKDALALRLTSDQPLSASLRMSPSNKDFAYAVAGQALDGPAVAPLSLGNLLDAATLALTAPGAKATVKVTAFDSTMTAQGSVSLALKAGSTLSYGLAGRFKLPLSDLAYVVVTPAGNVHGAALYTRGTGVSAVPLTAAPLKTVAPQVRPGR